MLVISYWLLQTHPPFFHPAPSSRGWCVWTYMGFLACWLLKWIQPMEDKRRTRLGLFIPAVPFLPGCHELAVPLYRGTTQLYVLVNPPLLPLQTSNADGSWVITLTSLGLLHFDRLPSPAHTFVVPLVSFPQITKVECNLFPFSCQGPDWYSYQCAFALASIQHF